ncbi:MAG: hypothetical protein ACOCX5_00730 [Chloroflexota bacterium]
MIQLYSLMWILAAFGACLGFIRGWNREIIGTAGIILGSFALFQFDALIRGTLLLTFPREQAFFIQLAVFLIIVFFAYQNRMFEPDRRDENSIQSGILGGLVGFANGYLIGGAIWYFMDINEYPFAPAVLAPASGSPSAESINAIPLVILSGGAGGSGDLLLVGVIVLFLIVLIVI